MQKSSLLTYHFKELRHVTDNYSEFTFTHVSSLLHHHKDFYELILVTKGEWQHTIGNTTSILPTGSLLLFKPGCTHVIFSKSTDNMHLVFNVQQDYFEEFVMRSFPSFNLEQLPDCLTKPISVEKRKYIEYLAKTIHEPSGSPQIMADEILFSCISDFIYTNQGLNQNTYILDIIQKLNTYIYLNDSITDICSHYPIARSTLLHQFKEATGMTVVQYKAQQKLNYACHLLKHSTTSISELASQLQYDSLSYFVRLFKKTYGMTPTEYRKSYSNPSGNKTF